MTKNRQKTEPERTIYKVNNTIRRVQVKKTSDNHKITQDIHFLYKRLSMKYFRPQTTTYITQDA